MRIIPAIDIIEGKCVRLSQGDYDTKKVYHENPLEVAKEFEAHGIQYLHLVDLDGAKSKKIINHKVLESIAQNTHLEIDFGGGLKSEQDIKIAFESGASKITLGSLAVKNPDLFLACLEKYGNDKIILGADAKDRKIASNGWLESSELDVLDFIQEYEKKGVKEVICTDISKDGQLQGASIPLYQEILAKTEVNLVASGGVSNLQDVKDLSAIGCDATIIGKAIYEGRVSLKELVELE